MGLRGPPPRLRVVAGSVKPGTGSIFEPGTPRKPSWLSAAAKVEWDRIVPELQQANLLSVVDRVALAAYCQAWAELEITTTVVEDEGRVVKEPIQSASGQVIGHVLKAHPAVRMQRDAFNRVRQFLTEFGLSPAARARLGSASKPSRPEATMPGNRLHEIRNRVEAARQGGKTKKAGA